MKPQGKTLEEYALSELQEIVEYILDEHASAKAAKDKGAMKHWKEKYADVVEHYNKRAGSQIWQKQIYE